jgi:hypothetical protein
VECYYCREEVEGDKTETGARCPRCRRPLYEESETYELEPRVSRRRPPGLCPLHPHSTALGICQRCGNFICVVCRTRWAGISLCTGCIERGLEAKEANPEAVRNHRRQAVLALVFGGCAWGFVLGGLLLASLAKPEEGGGALLPLAILLLIPSPFFAVLGVGQGTAAIRQRGDQLIVATIGLLLSGLYLGGFLGVIIALLRLSSIFRG